LVANSLKKDGCTFNSTVIGRLRFYNITFICCV
jgi:hypothetical protein